MTLGGSQAVLTPNVTLTATGIKFNSSSQPYRTILVSSPNNWNIIEKFIKKQELDIKEIDFNLLMDGNREKLREFIVLMYETLTKKKFSI